MMWLQVVVVAVLTWCALAVVVSLVIGRGIAVADRYDRARRGAPSRWLRVPPAPTTDAVPHQRSGETGGVHRPGRTPVAHGH